jgi:NADPH2:quinone reductase
VRAAWYERTGPAADVLQVGELPDPQPGPGEILVRVEVSGINPTDWRSRMRPSMRFPRVIPHQDGAGTIVAVGQGIDPARVGERAWLWDAAYARPGGTAAELTVQPAAHVMPLPEVAPFELGACLGIPARTAHRALYADGPIDGQTILVTGGAGAVGFYAIQIAKLGDATVIATVSGDDKAEIARTAGADHVLNYREDDVAAMARELTGGTGVDRVVEVAFAANLDASLGALRDNGTLMTYAVDDLEPRIPARTLLERNISVRWMLVYTMPAMANAAALDTIQVALLAGGLKPLPIHRYGLEDIVAAHEAVEGGQVGKVVIGL